MLLQFLETKPFRNTKFSVLSFRETNFKNISIVATSTEKLLKQMVGTVLIQKQVFICHSSNVQLSHTTKPQETPWVKLTLVLNEHMYPQCSRHVKLCCLPKPIICLFQSQISVFDELFDVSFYFNEHFLISVKNSEAILISGKKSLFQGKIPYFRGKSLISGENTLNSYPGM